MTELRVFAYGKDHGAGKLKNEKQCFSSSEWYCFNFCALALREWSSLVVYSRLPEFSDRFIRHFRFLCWVLALTFAETPEIRLLTVSHKCKVKQTTVIQYWSFRVGLGTSVHKVRGERGLLCCFWQVLIEIFVEKKLFEFWGFFKHSD